MERRETVFDPPQADPRYLLCPLLRRWWLIAIAALAAALLLWAARALLQGKDYTAQLTFAVTAEEGALPATVSATTEAAAVYARLLEGELMAQAAHDTLGAGYGTVRAVRLGSTNLIRVTVGAETAQGACLLAQVVLDNYTAVCQRVSPHMAIAALDGHSVTAQSSRQEAAPHLYAAAAVIGGLAMCLLLVIRQLRQSGAPEARRERWVQQGEDLVHIDLLAFARHILPALRRIWAMILVPAIVCGACLFWYTAANTQTLCEADVIVSVGVGNGEGTDLSSYDHYYDSRTANYLIQVLPRLLQSRTCQELLSEKLGTALRETTVSARSVGQTNSFVLTAAAESGEEARRTVQALLDIWPQMCEPVMGDVQLLILREVAQVTPSRLSLPGARWAIIGALLGALPGCALAAASTLLIPAVQPYRRRRESGEGLREEQMR